MHRCVCVCVLWTCGERSCVQRLISLPLLAGTGRNVSSGMMHFLLEAHDRSQSTNAGRLTCAHAGYGVKASGFQFMQISHFNRIALLQPHLTSWSGWVTVVVGEACQQQQHGPPPEVDVTAMTSAINTKSQNNLPHRDESCI